MPESTAKKELLEEGVFTPAKIMVIREINGWMETNAKIGHFQPARAQSQHLYNKIKAKKHLKIAHPNKNIINGAMTEVGSPNIEEMKNRKMSLMKSSSLDKKDYLNAEKTKGSTAEESPSSNNNKKEVSWFKRIPLVQVNEFVIEEKEKQKQPVSIMPEIKLFPVKCSPITTRKSTLKRVERKSPFSNYQDTRGYRNLSKEINTIIQEKLQKNHHTGLLSTISRKTCNVLVTLKQDQVKVK